MSPTVRTRSIVALALVFLMAASTVAVAQEDAQEDSHPIIGAWLLEITDTGTSGALLLVGPGGTLINESFDSTGVGTWAPVDESSAIFTFHAPAGETLEDRFSQLVTIRGAVTVSPDGETFDGTWTIQFPEGQEQYGPGQVVGRRIAAEEMGEPAGPME